MKAEITLFSLAICAECGAAVVGIGHYCEARADEAPAPLSEIMIEVINSYSEAMPKAPRKS